jgi:hypothetical protein
MTVQNDMLELLKFWETSLSHGIPPLKGQLQLLRAVIAKAERQSIEVVDEIAAERRNQIADGRDADHDAQLAEGELAAAAAAYATSDFALWPWSQEWWKPRDRRSNYLRAAALLIAEIEKLDRKADAA